MTIFSAFQRLLIPPNVAADEETLYTARLVASMAALTVVLTLIYSLVWVLVMPQYLWRLIFTVVALVATGWSIILVRSGHVRSASLVFEGGMWLLVTLVTASAGGTRAPFFGLYTLIVLFAALVSGWRAAITFVVLSIAAGFGMVILDQGGVIPLPLATPLSAYLSQIVIMLLLTITTYFTVSRSNEALHRARHELAERKRMEAALRESEERFRLVSSMTSDYTFSSRYNADNDLENFQISGAFESISGYTTEEFAARGGWRTTLHPDDIAVDDTGLALLRQNKPTVSEMRIIRKSGEIRWIRIYAHPVWDAEHNALVGINGAVQDITEHKHADELLSKERQLLRAVIDHLPDNIYVKDCEGRFILNNAESMRILGVCRQDDLLGKSDFDFFPAEQAAEWLADEKSIMESGITILTEEVFHPWNQHERRWVVSSHIPLHDEHGTVIGLVGINRDISERKQAEEALRRSEASLRGLLDATTDVAFLMSPDEKFLTLNKTQAQSFGRTVEEMVGQKALEIMPPDVREKRRQYFETVLQTGQPVRWQDENIGFYWDNSIYPVLSPSGTVEAFAVYGRDITEQKKLEAELQRYNTQLEAIIEERTTQLRRAKEQIEIILNNTHDAVALAQPNGDVQTINPAFTETFGSSVSQSIEHILSHIVTDDQVNSVGNALLNVIWDNEHQRVETQVTASDGKDRDIDLAFIPVSLGGNVPEQGILVSAHDITHVKEIERFKARFVADALHDMATPITGLSTRLYLLKRSPAKLEEHVRALENQVEHLRDLLMDLRTLSQIDRGHLELSRESCQIEELLRRIFDTYEPVAISRQQTLQLTIDPSIPALSIDRRLFERVLVNLVSNAVKYSEDGKTVEIHACVVADKLEITVTDHGIGISATDLPHIFERFYRTEQARQSQTSGTGLGLAIVKDIIALHGGRVTAESIPGLGSTFRITLPVNTA